MGGILIGYIVIAVLGIYTIGYFVGKSKANKEFVKFLLKYEIRFGRYIADKIIKEKKKEK